MSHMNQSNRSLTRTICITLILAVVIAALFSVTAFAAAPKSAADVTLKVSDKQISIAWKAESNVSFYSVWRSLSATGENALCIGIVEGDQLATFVDKTAVVGSSYYYAVQVSTSPSSEKPDPADLTWKGPVKLEVTWDGVYSPHLGTRFTAKHESGCRTCHAAGKMDSGVAADKRCLECHMESQAPGQASVGMLFAKTGSGHAIQTEADPAAALTCATCHDPHSDSNANNALAPKEVSLGSVFKKPVVSGQNGTCYTCHDDNQSWFTQTSGTAYPDTAAPVRETALTAGYFDYPTLGTYTGESAYKASGHAMIKASGGMGTGDCRYCHSSHRTDAPYDGLLTSTRGEFRAQKALADGSNVVNPSERLSGDYAAFCLSCHGTDRNELDPRLASDEATSTNIRTLVVPTESDVATSTAGHKITSANATVPEGSNMPCYYCHNPHGSKGGNVANISDERGVNITKDDLSRNFCFTCHASYEGHIWDTTQRTWITPTDTDKVVGLSRTGLDKTILRPDGIANKLKLTTLANGAHQETSDTPCITCHGDIHHPTSQQMVDVSTLSILTGSAQVKALGSAKIAGNAYFDVANVSVLAVGVEYSTTQNFTAATTQLVTLDSLDKANTRLDGGHYFDISVSGLTPGATYYYRAIRDNGSGNVEFGEVGSFTVSWF